MGKPFVGMFLIFSLLFAGCSKDMNTVGFREISIEPKLMMTPGEKIPAGVGLFLPPAFRDYRYRIDQYGIGNIVYYQGDIEIGRNTGLAFYQLLGALFSHVVLLEDYTPQAMAAAGDIAFVAVPRIERFDFKTPYTGLSNYEVRLALGCTFYDRRGATVLATVKTAARQIGSFSALRGGGGPHEAVKNMVQEACEDALDQTARQIVADRARFPVSGNTNP
ncbi:MAG TPA: hypothetical protein PK175_09225 [Syntrophales bacterium]|jgi:hypothetical protein|nr:hypothetical protein [Syntrophales bacterium]HON22258.1 hypothetical protein [Syntrophales bacterium]HOU78637.1 hypothetical protein [Syntrophales bacterium]HPC33430.1 hypothetical protein [Syntrophales bacterium]HQG35040.1 hypothetical protein [Syntrophales bacterium]